MQPRTGFTILRDDSESRVLFDAGPNETLAQDA